ncbi:MULTISPECIES: carbohydrate ABC transporter permease [Microbacterium]|uniref:carbohydrate ABC transporter permease n=1 Tax=Microbacterium TaxID=33882 RepID=UPI00146BBF50|nr:MULTISPECIES: carbohydrate ABC transporter permease [Microbacterium]
MNTSKRPRASGSRLRLNPIAHVLAWLYAALLAIPIIFIVFASFKDNTEIFTAPFALPTSLDISNFVAAWNRVELGLGLVNSTLTTVAAEILTLVLAIPAAYAIARSTGRFGLFVERLFALGLLIPAFAALVPTLLLAVVMGLFQTREFFILFLPATALPLSVILLAQFMRAVPQELEESAMLDGASRLRILVSVYVPLTIPGVVTVLILNFLTFWNEYLFALILIGPRVEERTVQVALPTLISLTSTDYGVLLAGCLITMIPVYLVYILLQRRMEDALLQGAVKS